MTTMDEEVQDWKNKYETTEIKFNTLKKMAEDSIGDYESLLQKYNESQQQFKLLKKELVVTQTKLNNLENVLEPACEEFGQLQERYEVEKHCRSQAENFAATCYNQNVKLKRQSRVLLDRIQSAHLSVSDFEKISEDEIDGCDDHLNRRVQALEHEIAVLEEKLATVDTERIDAYNRETQLKTECFELQQKVANCDMVLDNWRRMVEQSCNDYEELSKKYDMEQDLNHEAVLYARKVLSERDAMARESAVLLASAAADQRLMDALQQIELITREAAVEKLNCEDKIRTLEVSLAACGEAKRIHDLENRLHLITTEYDNLQRSYKELDKWKVKVEKENENLINQLDVAQQMLRPPPPPPPPPPPMILSPLKYLMKKKLVSVDGVPLTRAGRPKDKTYEEALQEMMDRIKRGNPLKSVQSRLQPEKSEQPESLTELQRAMITMRKVSATNAQ